MVRVGLVGGLGPESTIDYYKRILAAWHREDPKSAPSIVIDSLDVQRGLHLVEHDRAGLIDYLLGSIRRLAAAGVDFVALTANTPHIVFDELTAQAPVPLLSIVEVCAEEARRRGLHRLLLLGTRFTMEASFYPDVCARYGVTVVPPGPADRTWIHAAYIDELLVGDFRDRTRERFRSLVGRMKDDASIDGVILGGTELPLLLQSPTIEQLPAIDTTALHVDALVRRLLGSQEIRSPGVFTQKITKSGNVGSSERVMTSSDSRTMGALQELDRIRTRIEAAENAGDGDAIAALMANDVVVMVPSEPVQEGRAECAAFIRRTLAETYSYFDRRIVYTSAEVRVAGDVAFDRGTFAFEVQPKSGGEKSQATGKYLWLYSRSQDDGWKLSRAIVSLDEEEEAEAAG